MIRPQLEFLSLFSSSRAKRGSGFTKPGFSFGGSLLNGNNPKAKRPLDSKLPVHLVLRAAHGGMRQLKVYGEIESIIQRASHRHGIKIYRHANVGNHLHFLIRIPNRKLWQRFIRELTGRIAQLMKDTGFAKKDTSFWLVRPYTRLVNGWKRAYKIAKEYVELNQLEAEGMINRHEMKSLKDLRAVWAET